MAECVWEALNLGRRMGRYTEPPYYLSDCPFQPGSELAFAWRKGFLNPNSKNPRPVFPERVNWRRDGF
jgi:hypothetical protein